MGTGTQHGRTLHATLCEIELGVFYASYPYCASASEVAELTTYQIGASAADAKKRIERAAHALGYVAVIWTETVVAPLFASHAKTVLHDLATTSRLPSFFVHPDLAPIRTGSLPDRGIGG